MAILPTMDTNGLGSRIASVLFLLQFLMDLRVPLQPFKAPLYLHGQHRKISCHFFVTFQGVMAARVELGG